MSGLPRWTRTCRPVTGSGPSFTSVPLMVSVAGPSAVTTRGFISVSTSRSPPVAAAAGTPVSSVARTTTTTAAKAATGLTPCPPAARWRAGSAASRRRRPAVTRARRAAPRPPRTTSMSSSESSPPVARRRKWCTVLWTRRSSATNQKSMVPSGATTHPMMPVSSSTSRTAACSAVSPSSMWPFGSDHSSRPRRSNRPMTAAAPDSWSTIRPPAEVSSTVRSRRLRSTGRLPRRPPERPREVDMSRW